MSSHRNLYLSKILNVHMKVSKWSTSMCSQCCFFTASSLHLESSTYPNHSLWPLRGGPASLVHGVWTIFLPYRSASQCIEQLTCLTNKTYKIKRQIKQNTDCTSTVTVVVIRWNIDGNELTNVILDTVVVCEYVESRTSGASMSRNSMMSGFGGTEKMKDARPLHDKSYVQQCIRQLHEVKIFTEDPNSTDVSVLDGYTLTLCTLNPLFGFLKKYSTLAT